MDAIKEKIFDFAYHEALNDATLQRAYMGKKDAVEKIAKAKAEVKKYVDAILQGKPNWFYKTESEVEGIINEALNKERSDFEYFTFGNVQKLINMTVKYFYIASYCDERLRENFSACHCPMDGKMIANVRNMLVASGKDCGELKSNLSWSRLCSNSPQITVTENNEDYSVPAAYAEFQQAITDYCNKESILPIEFDFENWK